MRRWEEILNGFNILPSVSGDKLSPHKFVLHQNYPNPFNPSTTIRYEIQDTRFVTLKVYNSIGQEVATLVNKQQSSGLYEVKFDASSTTAGLNSGIYFYTLQSGSFYETKKMIILK